MTDRKMGRVREEKRRKKIREKKVRSKKSQVCGKVGESRHCVFRTSLCAGFLFLLTAYSPTIGLAFLLFPSTAKANGVFSLDRLPCVPVGVAVAGSGRFPNVREGSSEPARCRLQAQVPEGSGGFRKVVGGSAGWGAGTCAGCKRTL